MSLLNVTVDIPGIEELTTDMAQTVISEALTALGAFAQDRLREMANQKLSAPLAKQYVAAIKLSNPEKTRIVISMDDPVASNLEKGRTEVDLKPLMLRSAKAKQGKNGPFVDVPFQHSTSKRTASSSVSYIQSRGPRAIVQGLIKAGLATGHTQKAFQGAWSPSSKKRRIADMYVKPQGATKSAELVTFRRISANSPASSWIVPAKEGLNIFSTVVDDVNRIKTPVVEDILKKHSR